MKKIFMLLLVLIIPGVAQDSKFVLDNAQMISGAADSIVKIVTFKDWEKKAGNSGLYVAGYSNSDGASVDLFVKYKLYLGKSNQGDSLFTNTWLTLDTLLTTQISSDSILSGSFSGEYFDFSSATLWQSAEGVKINYYWAPSSSDTINLISKIFHPNSR